MDQNTKRTPAAVKILDTASQLFYWKGIHSIGVETIASEAGVTKKTLYDRFGSKDQLIVAYLKERDRLWRNHLDGYLDNVPEEKPFEKIQSIFDALESWLETKNRRGCAFVNALAELPEESHPGREVIIEEKRWLKELFIRYLEKMEISQPDEIGEKLLMLHEGYTVTFSMGLATHGITTIKQSAAEMMNG